LPEASPGILRVAAVGLVLAILFYLGWVAMRGIRTWDARRGQSTAVLVLLLLFFGSYVLVVVASNILLRAYTPLDTRILSPLFVVGVVLFMIAAGHGVLASGSRSWISLAVVAGMAVFGVFSIRRGAASLRQGIEEGLGFNSRSWRQSAILQIVKDMPGEFPVYSNAPEAIYVQSGRVAERIPLESTSLSGIANADFRAQVEQMFARVVERRGIVIYFALPWRASSLSVEDLVSQGDLAIVYQSDEGTILAARPEE
jgi:hypothetical protein